MPGQDSGRELTLTGLEGHNPLAYLAALGTLRLLSRVWPEQLVRMAWRERAGAWRPVMSAERSVAADEVVAALDAEAGRIERLLPERLLQDAAREGPKTKTGGSAWADKLRFPLEIFAGRARELIGAGELDGAFALGGWASDADSDDVDNREVAVRTRFDFTAGQQAFLAMIRSVREECSALHIRESLFRPWRYVPGTSMRWDPLDEKRQYALQAIDPTDSSANPILTVPGANLLAVEALPLFAFAATRRGLGQPGFGAGGTPSWTWPIWSGFIGLDSVRTVLASAGMSGEKARARGIVVRYQSLITMPSGRYRCFTPARPV